MTRRRPFDWWDLLRAAVPLASKPEWTPAEAALVALLDILAPVDVRTHMSGFHRERRRALGVTAAGWKALVHEANPSPAVLGAFTDLPPGVVGPFRNRVGGRKRRRRPSVTRLWRAYQET